MLLIDGSDGEGGGQILRTSLALSLLTGKPVTIDNIRASRPTPGLRPQHLAGVRALGEISGSTLLGNGLREVETVFRSEAVLIAQPNLSAGQAELLDQLQFRMQAVRRAKRNKYIVLNAPVGALDEVRRLLPGIKSPTVTPLAEAGWVSVQSVVQEDDFWHITGQLKAVGAEGILVLPIEKMIA